MSTEKVSVSLPADLVAEARLYSAGNLSAYLAQGLRRQLLSDRQQEYLTELEEEFGQLTDEEMDEARRLWRDEA